MEYMYPCWLCSQQFENKRDLKKHISSVPHSRIQIVCPWCSDLVVTANRSNDLKKHVKRSHRAISLQDLPRDFFSEGNGYYMALYPDDYKKICLPGHPSSQAAKLAIELVTKIDKVWQDPPKSTEEWQHQWETATELVEFPPAIPTTLPMVQFASEPKTQSPSPPLSEKMSPMPNDSTKESTRNSASGIYPVNSNSVHDGSKSSTLTESSADILGTRSWLNALPIPQVLSPKSNEPHMTSPTSQISLIAPVPSTVLTPPGTPTPLMMSAASSSASGITSSSTGSTDPVKNSNQGGSRITENDYICDVCGRLFKDDANLRQHMRSHYVDRPYKCLQCGKRFRYLSSYQYHLKIAHASDKDKIRPFKCVVCKCNFRGKERLINHDCRRRYVETGPIIPGAPSHVVTKPIKSDTKQPYTYKCDICQLGFRLKSSLESHKLIHSTPNLPCPICKKQYPRIGFLKCHVLKAHKIKLATLAKNGNKKAELLMKVKQHIPRPNVCKECGNRFEKKETLRTHMENNHKKYRVGDKERSIQHKCTHCEAKFDKVHLLEMHVLDAHPVRTVEMQQPSTTTDSNAYIQPLSSEKKPRYARGSVPSHLKEFACDICGARYQHRHSLYRHIKTHLDMTDDEVNRQGSAEDNNSQANTPSNKHTVRRVDNSNANTPGNKHRIQQVNKYKANSPDNKHEESNSKPRTHKKYVNNVPYRNRPGYAKMGIDANDVRIENLGEKVKSNENGTTTYRCKMCLATYNSLKKLIHHLTTQADFHCTRFTMKLSTLLYEGLTERQRRMYERCDICGLFYTNQSSYYSHMGKHMNNKTAGQERASDSMDQTSDPGGVASANNSHSKLSTSEIVLAANHNNSESDLPQIEIVNDSEEMEVGIDSEEQSLMYDPSLQGYTYADHNLDIDNQAQIKESHVADSEMLVYPKHEPEIDETLVSHVTVEENIISHSESVGSNDITSLRHDQSTVQTPCAGSGNFIDTNQNSETQTSDNIAQTRVQHSDLTGVGVEYSINNSNCSEKRGDDKTARNVLCVNEDGNDYNSSDEESMFDDESGLGDQGPPKNIPVGTNTDCVQCQMPFLEQQSTVTCRLCSKRFCRECSQLPRKVYNYAFRGPSNGLVWMCKICKSAFPTYMTLLRQLAQFEDVLNKRLTGVSQRLTSAEHNIALARGKGSELQ